MHKIDILVTPPMGCKLPEYETQGSAGIDLVATTNVTLRPGERSIIPTGLKVAIPEGFEIQVRPRSGLAYKHGITVLNAPGTIDADYRGEIGVILYNTSNDTYQVTAGDRVAQAVLCPVFQINWVLVDELPDTPRGEGGFGSTGK